MTNDQVLSVAIDALVLAIAVSLPSVLAAMLVGLLMSIFQASTQIQEQTLTTVPKILAVVLALAISGAWAVGRVAAFATHLLERIPELGG